LPESTNPTLCWYPKLPVVGNCRICLVSVEGQPKLLPAWRDAGGGRHGGQAESHAAVENRRGVLRLLLERYPGDHLVNGDRARPRNEFERYVVRYGVVPTPPGGRDLPLRHGDERPGDSMIRHDMSTCILCTRCVRACEDIQVVGVLDVGQRGEHTEIIVGATRPRQGRTARGAASASASAPPAHLRGDAAGSASPRSASAIRTVSSGRCARYRRVTRRTVVGHVQVHRHPTPQYGHTRPDDTVRMADALRGEALLRHHLEDGAGGADADALAAPRASGLVGVAVAPTMISVCSPPLAYVQHSHDLECPHTRARSACTVCTCSCRGESSSRPGARAVAQRQVAPSRGVGTTP